MTQIDLEEWLTSSQGDTPASPSRLPGSDEAIKTTDTSGQKCLELSKLSGPLGSLEKTLLATSLWASTRCYLTWKAKDTKQGALLFRLLPQMPRTDATDAGLWPTPVTRGFDGQGSLEMLAQVAKDRAEWDAMSYRVGPKKKQQIWPTDDPKASEKGRNSSGSLNPEFIEWIMGYPVGYTDLNS